MHAYVDSPLRFGWNFRENASGDTPSILGLHRGIVLLQARSEVKKIRVKYTVLSEWNDKPNDEGEDNFDLRESDNVCLVLPSPKSTKPDYDNLVNLDQFPALIHNEKACRILHISEEPCLEGLLNNYKYKAGKPLLRFTPDNKYVIKSSLEKYLGIEKRKEEKKP